MPIECLEIVKRSNTPHLWAKYHFAKEYITQNYVKKETELAYLETIKYMNGFVEVDPFKRSPQDYLEKFIALISSVKINGLQAPRDRHIKITPDFKVIDGAHRLAIGAALNLTTSFYETVPIQSQSYSFSDLESNGLSQNVTAEILLKMILSNPNYRVLIIFPSAEHSPESLALIKEYEKEILYRSQFECNYNLLLVIKYINYIIGDGIIAAPNWTGHKKATLSGIHEHSILSSGLNPLQLFLLRSDSSCLALKRELRTVFKVGNYSCHSTDSQFETVLITGQLLNRNSRFLSSNCELKSAFEIINGLRIISTSNRESLLSGKRLYIVGSTIMGLQGLRKISDIDILANFPLDNSSLIRNSVHLAINPVENGLKTKYQKILDECGSAYFFGLQIMTLDGLERFKQARREIPKDVNDLELIRKYRLSNTQNTREDRTSPKDVLIPRNIRWRLIRQKELLRLKLVRFEILYRIIRWFYQLRHKL
jgi:hypothetical protein